MKKIITLIAIASISSASAYAQSYIAGLDFSLADNPASDLGFDSGVQSSLFTLNLQTGIADDNFTYSVSTLNLTDPGWAALGDTLTDGGTSFNVGQGGTLPTVEVLEVGSLGFSPSSIGFGGTTATAQGFSSTAGISFTQATSGIFSITTTSAINDLSIGFEIGAIAGQGQSAGSILVGGQSVSVGTTPSFESVFLGNVSAGAIAFDLSGLDAGATFDNFMVSGTVVPEPSTYAAIAGVLALGFVVYRRRRHC